MASALPYADASLERILSSLMIHHLNTADKRSAALEVQRVLKPGGQLHVVDFRRPRSFYGGLLARLAYPFVRLIGRTHAGETASRLKKTLEAAV
jgi:ubiquinone/menaquinone biosynthesis C-methylase UbiE